MKNNNTRNRLISMIHAQQTAAGFDADAGRDIKFRITGKYSCKDCSTAELFEIFSAFNKILLSQHRQAFYFRSNRTTKPTMREAVEARADKILGTDSKDRLQRFVAQRLHKISLAYCTDKELRSVMGFLSTVERRGKGEIS
jgi:hypothetical protein